MLQLSNDFSFKNKVLKMAYNVMFSPSLFPEHTGILLPQDLCIYCSLCLKWFYPNILMAHSLTFFWSLPYHVVSEASPGHRIQNCNPLLLNITKIPNSINVISVKISTGFCLFFFQPEKLIFKSIQRNKQECPGKLWKRIWRNTSPTRY